MDNIISLDEHFIAGMSDNFTARLHSHPVLEIYSSCDGNSHAATENQIIEGQIIVIGTQLSHAIADEGKYGLAVFIDPLSETGYSIMQNVLADNQFTVVYDENIKNHLSELLINHTEANVHSAANAIITSIRGNIVQRPFSAPVMETVEMIRCEEENFDMDHIAGKIHLSKSRIAHIFSEQTGITLKSYLQFKRMERAFRQMAEGSSITKAAFDTGFSGSSHIASSSRKLLGMQLRELLNI